MPLRLAWSFLLSFALVLGSLLLPSAGMAQDDAPADGSGAGAPAVQTAPVIVDAERLFDVRGFSVLPAEERAEFVRNRIIAIALASEETFVEVDIIENEIGQQIFFDGRLVTVVTEADARLEGVGIEILTALQTEAIEKAILDYRNARTSSARVNSAIEALGWTVGFILLTVLILWRRRRLVRRIGRVVEHSFVEVEEATQSVVRGKAVARAVELGLTAVIWIVWVLIFYYYLSIVLLSFAETRTIATLLLTYVSEPLLGILLGLADFIPNLIVLLIIFIVTRYIINVARVLFDNIRAGTLRLARLEPEMATPTFNLVRVAIIIVAITFAYPYIPGSDSQAFQGLTILAGIMVSLGSNSVISNVIAGFLVIYRQSTKVGDRIRVGDRVGDVVEIKIMETLMKSVKNEMVSIPNSELLNSVVMNYSRKIDGRGLLVHSTVGIGYEEPPEKVKAMLIEAAQRTPGIKRTPKPFVLWTALADYAINYEINAFTTRGSDLPRIYSDLHENIVTVFNENGTQIMTPSYMADPDEPKIPTEPWDGTLSHEREADQ